MLRLLALALTLGLLAPAAAQTTLPVPDEGSDTAQGAPRGDGPADPAATKQQLKKQRGWLGVALKQTSPETAQKLGFKKPLIQVDMVFTGSPAHASGFQVGDLILGFQGEDVREVADLVKRVGGTEPGTQVTFTRMRDGEKEDIPLLLGVRPEAYQMLKDMFLDKPAPEIQGLEHASTTAFDAEKAQGKVVLLDFWATWCGPCRDSLPHISKLHETYKDKGLVVIGLTDEDAETVSGFLEGTPLPYTVVRDESRETNRAFFVNALPTLFIIDREGIVRGVHIGARNLDEIEGMITELLEE